METEQFDTPVEEPTAPPAETEGESGTPETEELSAEKPEEARPSSGIQQRIDELVRAREDQRREKEYWRTVALQTQTAGQEAEAPPKVETAGKPISDDFETYDEYVEALAEWKADVKWRENQRTIETQTRQHAFNRWHDKGREKYADWDETFGLNVTLPVSQTMAEILSGGDSGIEMAYYLGKNPDEAQRIFQLSPLNQAKELGRLEVKLATSPPPQKTTTNAPTPTSPVGGKETPAKKPEDMSYEEYKAWRMGGGGGA